MHALVSRPGLPDQDSNFTLGLALFGVDLFFGEGGAVGLGIAIAFALFAVILSFGALVWFAAASASAAVSKVDYALYIIICGGGETYNCSARPISPF